MSVVSRFVRAIRGQDWGTAIIDVVVVAIGILMALAVDNWRTEREYRAQEFEILRRVHQQVQDVEPDLVRSHQKIEERHELLVEVRRLLYGLTPGRALSDEECDMLASSHILAANDWRIPAFEELLNSGRLSSLQESEIRDSALNYLDHRDAQASRIAWSASLRTVLTKEFPDLVRVQLRNTDDPDDNDGLVPGGICDTEGMMMNLKFLHSFNANFQYVIQNFLTGRRALQEFEKLHELLDARLNIEHIE